MLTKEQAQLIFDRLDEAGLDVQLRHGSEKVDVRTIGSAEPEYVRSELAYQVEVALGHVTPAELRLIADLVERHDAKTAGELAWLVLR